MGLWRAIMIQEAYGGPRRHLKNLKSLKNLKNLKNLKTHEPSSGARSKSLPPRRMLSATAAPGRTD